MSFEHLILDSEPLIRLGFFIGVFAAMALWEVFAPRRALTLGRGLRWASNLGIVALNTIIIRLLFPAAAVGAAAFCAAQGWGLLNMLDLPLWLAIALAVIVMDFVIWLQHVVVHAVPLLWRLHRVHHADLDYDVTTGARFHPLEIVLSMLIKFATIVALGPPVVAVVIFEVVLNASSMFNHGNVRLSAAVDRVLRLFVVTPDMHRVHHSVLESETNSNFGFCLPWWDRLFGTYRPQPRDGHVGMVIGLAEFRDPHQADRLPGMLAIPFRATPSGRVNDRR